MGLAKNIPETDRIVACTLHKEGYTYRQIAERIGCSFQHVGYILKRFQETGMFEDRHRTGRPKIYTDRDARNLTKLVKENRKASSSLLATKWELSSGAKASARTVRCVALSKGYSWKAAAKKPRLTKQAQKDRLKWCQQ